MNETDSPPAPDEIESSEELRQLYVFLAMLYLLIGSAYLAPSHNLTAQRIVRGATQHTVQAGDNLYQIGLRYGVTSDAIAVANRLSNANAIFVGDPLIIPSLSVAPTTPVREIGGGGIETMDANPPDWQQLTYQDLLITQTDIDRDPTLKDEKVIPEELWNTILKACKAYECESPVLIAMLMKHGSGFSYNKFTTDGNPENESWGVSQINRKMFDYYSLAYPSDYRYLEERGEHALLPVPLETLLESDPELANSFRGTDIRNFTSLLSPELSTYYTALIVRRLELDHFFYANDKVKFTRRFMGQTDPKFYWKSSPWDDYACKIWEDTESTTKRVFDKMLERLGQPAASHPFSFPKCA